MSDIPIFKVDNLIKLSKRGQIHRIYAKMYQVADELAVHETKNFLIELGITKGRIGSKENVKLMIDYKKERIEYHLNRMEKLLDKYIKITDKEKE